MKEVNIFVGDEQMNYMRELFRNKKNIYNIAAVLVIGALFIIMSDSFFGGAGKENVAEVKADEIQVKSGSEEDYGAELEKRLEETLSCVEGVGRVKVMLTLENSAELIVKQDIKTDSSQTQEDNAEGKPSKSSNTYGTEEKTVVNSSAEPFVVQEKKPQIKGIVIVADGGGSAEIKSALINAAKALTGVEVHKIEVLKMKQ